MLIAVLRQGITAAQLEGRHRAIPGSSPGSEQDQKWRQGLKLGSDQSRDVLFPPLQVSAPSAAALSSLGGKMTGSSTSYYCFHHQGTPHPCFLELCPGPRLSPPLQWEWQPCRGAHWEGETGVLLWGALHLLKKVVTLCLIRQDCSGAKCPDHGHCFDHGQEQEGMRRDCSCPLRPIAPSQSSLTSLSALPQSMALPFDSSCHPCFWPSPFRNLVWSFRQQNAINQRTGLSKLSPSRIEDGNIMRTDFSEFLTALLLAYHHAAVRITCVNGV